MTFLVLYVSTAVLFLAADAIGLTLMIRPLFERHIGDLLVPGFRMLPAIAFYLFYVGVVVWLVSWPVYPFAGGYVAVAVQAALIGALAYGTYEFTNLATLKPWHWSMVAVDMTWGTVLTAGSVTGGLAFSRWVMG